MRFLSSFSVITVSSLFAFVLACGGTGSDAAGENPAGAGAGDSPPGAPSGGAGGGSGSATPGGATASPPASPPAPPAPLGKVRITNDWTTFVHLTKPYLKLDETGLGGFEFLLSSKSGFSGNEQYINIGDETDPSTAIGTDLGASTVASGVPFDFSIKHVAKQNHSFRLTNTVTGTSTTLCWGTGCPAGSVAATTLNGKAPIRDFNGLQVQVRAQDVSGASTSVKNLKLVGVAAEPGSDPLFQGTATPNSPSTIPIDPAGRVGQWILGTDLAVVDWELTGTVTVSRPDGAMNDTSKVRFVVDFVRDTRLPIAP